MNYSITLFILDVITYPCHNLNADLVNRLLINNPPKAHVGRSRQYITAVRLAKPAPAWPSMAFVLQDAMQTRPLLWVFIRNHCFLSAANRGLVVI